MHNIIRLWLGICVHLFAVMVGPGNYSRYVHTCVCNILCRIVSAYRVCIYIYIYPGSEDSNAFVAHGLQNLGRDFAGSVTSSRRPCMSTTMIMILLLLLLIIIIQIITMITNIILLLIIMTIHIRGDMGWDGMGWDGMYSLLPRVAGRKDTIM